MQVPVGYILAEHTWRKNHVNGEPIRQVMSPRQWKLLPPYRGPDPITGLGQVDIPKQGYIQIDPKSLIKPKAAAEAEANAEAEADLSEDKISRLARSSKR